MKNIKRSGDGCESTEMLITADGNQEVSADSKVTVNMFDGSSLEIFLNDHIITSDPVNANGKSVRALGERITAKELIEWLGTVHDNRDFIQSETFDDGKGKIEYQYYKIFAAGNEESLKDDEELPAEVFATGGYTR